MREDWFKDQFNELTQSIQNGDKPWTYEKFCLFLSTVEKPFEATVDGYRCAVGGIGQESCFKTQAVQLLQEALNPFGKDNKNKSGTFNSVQQKRKRQETRTPNTCMGGDGLTTEARLT